MWLSRRRRGELVGRRGSCGGGGEEGVDVYRGRCEGIFGGGDRLDKLKGLIWDPKFSK